MDLDEIKAIIMIIKYLAPITIFFIALLIYEIKELIGREL